MGEREHPNETDRLLHERSNQRRYAGRKVPRDILDLVLGAGIHAATGGMRPYSIIKIEDEETKRRLAEIDGQAQICKAAAE